MIRNTKIVATIGPASETEEELEKLLRAGVNVCRFNLKHNTIEWHNQVIKRLKKLSKAINIEVGVMVDTPDKQKLFEVDDYDFVAVSYVKSGSEINILRRKLNKKGYFPAVIAKIENEKALTNLSEISKNSDGLMVARGDLGDEVPIEQIAYWQKRIIDWCRLCNIPVIVATQMLLSMVSSIKPTRAEATDVSNAVFDGTDALMLSEETALGSHPSLAVRQMSKIAVFCEQKGVTKFLEKTKLTTTEILVNAAASIVEGSQDQKINIVVVFSQSGKTAKMLSSYRLKTPIIVIGEDPSVLKRLELSYGVFPYFKKFIDSKFSIEDPVFDDLIKNKLINKGDNVLVVHGNNWMTTGSTTDISLKTV